MRHLVVACALALAACSGGTPAPAPDAPAAGSFGAQCTTASDTSTECTSGVCTDTIDKIGYPVVLKLYSETITHKTDVGGVQLNLMDADAVKKAWTKIKDSVTAKVGAEHFQGVTVQPMVRWPTLTMIVRVSPSTAFGGSPNNFRRLMIGMIAPRRLLTPSTYSGVWGILVTSSRMTISWICSIRKA